MRFSSLAITASTAVLLLLAASSIALLGTLGCSSRDSTTGDSITEQEFVDLYARLLAWRERQATGHGPAPGEATADTLSQADIERLERFVRQADLPTARWDHLLVMVRDRVRDMEVSQSERPSPGASPKHP